MLNIGKRPTIDDGDQRTVELHILHKYSRDFYGARLKAVIVGFIRSAPALQTFSSSEVLGSVLNLS